MNYAMEDRSIEFYNYMPKQNLYRNLIYLLYIVPVANAKNLKVLCPPRKPGESSYVCTQNTHTTFIKESENDKYLLKEGVFFGLGNHTQRSFSL